VLSIHSRSFGLTLSNPYNVPPIKGTLQYSRAHAVVVKCNIVCNGFGAKVLRESALTSTVDLTEMLNIRTRFRDFHERLPDANKYSIAPSDHSGVYIEQPELRWKTLS
jgi:hypothetical protein